MNSVILPPAPNWYLSSILSCANDGTVAWGAQKTIVIAKNKEEDEILQYNLIKNAHFERVTTLSFSPEFGAKGKNLLLSGGDDHIAKIWNLDTMTTLIINTVLDSKQTIIGVDWFKSDPTAACYVSMNGVLVYWNTVFNVSRKIYLEKMTATCFSCCPHESNIVAVGAKSGLVYIVDTRGSGSIVYKLRGHDTEVVSMSWCPVETNVLNNTDARDLLLASGGKDRSIFIWRAGGDGRYHAQITVPSNVMDSHQHKSKLSPAVGNWLAINWVEPKFLLTSSAWGELISWDLAMTTKNKSSCKVIHSNHSRGLFCIASIPKNYKAEDENWRTKEEFTIWTLAQDRLIICCTVKEGTTTIIYNIPTQGGYVYCMAACPLDTSLMAFGVGDAMLRLWNLSEPHKTSFDISMLWQKIKGKIRTIAWHPEKENLLAFGTGEGRVGLIYTNSNKPPILYRLYHRHVIYSISWGPVPEKTDYELYSCGDGELVYYNSEKPDEDPKSVIKKHCSEFAWKPDYSCMAVGFDDGTIKLYNRDLSEFGKTIRVVNKSIYRLVWHPQSTLSDLSISPMQNYIAVAINDCSITIIEITNDATETVADNSSFYKTVATLCGHSDAVVTLAWSPFFNDHLISGSYDCTIQVWSIETQEIIATYTGHIAPVICCMWSPLDPDYIISGSVDFSLRIWKLSDQKAIKPTSKPKKKTKSKKNKQKIEKDAKSEALNSVSESSSSIEIAEKCNEPEILSETGSYANKEVKNKLSGKDRYFPVHAKIMRSRTSIFTSIRNLLDTAKSCESSNLKEQYENMPSIFYNRDSTSKMIGKEVAEHSKRGHYSAATELEVWRDNLKETIKDAITENRLTDYLVSLAPSLSMKTWQETCEAYAMQLVSEENHDKAVTYLLTIHKIHSAIGVFVDAKMYKEAYILATCKLDSNDPLLSEILLNWANFSIKQGFFEEAAQCFTKLGEFSKAALLLARRADLSSLELAMDLALASGDKELSESVAEQAVTKALCNLNVATARELIKKCPLVSYREVHVDACEEILEACKMQLNSEIICKWLKEGSNHSLLDSLSKRYEERQSSLHSELVKRDFNVTINNTNALWVNVGYQIALAITSNTKEARLKYVVTGLAMISNFEVTNSQITEQQDSLLMRLIVILDAKSPENYESLFFDENLEVVKSLRAYLCVGIMSWFSRATDVDEYTDFVTGVLEKYVKDVFEPGAITFWAMKMKIAKTEAALSLAMGKVKIAEDEEDDNKSSNSVQDLSEQLNEMKMKKKEFADHRICVPNPVVAYSVSLVFSEKLIDEEKKSRFIKMITELWQNLQI